MSEQSFPDSSPEGLGQSSDVIFRMLTPVFMYKIEGAERFTHSRQIGTDSFRIQLISNTTFCAEIFPSYPADIQDGLQVGGGLTGISDLYLLPIAPLHYLVVDVEYRGGFHPRKTNARQYETLQHAVMDGLRFHSSAGLPCHHFFVFTCPSSDSMARLTTCLPNTRQKLRKAHLGPESVLKAGDFDACRSTIDRLVCKTWNDNTTSDKVLGLAKEYHWHSFMLERVEHAFLILMVAFEALFRKETEGNASMAAQRIARLLGAATQRDCKAIQNEFDNNPESFSKIRNRIAHGDPNLNLATVASKYPSLYRHVTAAIVRLLALSPGSVDDTKDYYDEISRIAEAHFLGLPKT